MSCGRCVTADSSIALLVALYLGAFVIGLSKAGFGGGLGMIVTPLWAIFMDADETVGLMLPLLLVGDIATLVMYWRAWDTKNVKTILAGAVIGIALGMFFMYIFRDEQILGDGNRVFKIFIGASALIFGLGQAARQWLVPHTQALKGRTWTGIVAGFGTGTISYLAHLGGLITTLYLLPQQLGNRVFVATSTIIFFLINLMKLPLYLIQGNLITYHSFMQDLSLVPAVVIGAAAGVFLNSRIPQKQFAWIVLGFVLLTGVKLLWEVV